MTRTADKTATCTVVVGADGRRCGEPAVHTFESAIEPGRVFAECAEHDERRRHGIRVTGGAAVGDAVEVHRHGKTYTGRVTRVTRGGTVYAAVTYENGARREVRV